ncbi:TPA: hypothetical protein VDV69_006170 [Pseudomonas aeruginosa]|nr:hypothetical protein [Pseudomonas aeruginosa]
MSKELTDVRCSCGDEYPADSYDAGFIAGSGMCQNCDAALPPKDICTCPSGDGSLRHPCPAHPAVEQACWDERDFQAKGAQEVPSPVSKEYDRHLIGLLRKGEALPGHQEEAADEIERLRDWNDHLNNTVLPNILNPNFLMLMKGGERLLDLCTKDGKFIGVSLNDMKDVFDWMVTHARIAPDHAALAQPSPVLPPFAEKVLAKLRRFYDCAEDFESGGVDIGRHWLDLLTQLGLLNRVQRSPALWEISQHGEDLLEAPVAQAQHSVPEISGIGRDAEHPRAVVLYLRNEPSDEDMRAIQNFLRAMPAAAPAQAQHSGPDGAADLCRFLAKLYCELDGLRYSTAKLPAEQIADALIFKWPVLQGARNQLNIKRISEQPYDESKLHSAIAAMLAAAPSEKRSCEYAGCCNTAHPGTSLCIAHHSKKAQERLLAAAPAQGGE